MLDQRDIDLIVEGVTAKIPQCQCPLDTEKWGIVMSMIRFYRVGERWAFRVFLGLVFGVSAIFAFLRGDK